MTVDAQVDLGPLVAELGDDVVVTDPERMDKYRWDRANDPDAGVPLAVVRAGSTEDVQTAVRFAAARGVPVVPRGAGSGLSGGASAVEGCLVVSTERMTAIEVDPTTRTAVVQPGLMNAQVKAAAAEHDLWYPPDPSSYEICSIGGNIATNAGGLCCVKYGVTTDYVLGLTVVLADGTAVRLGGARLKDVAGLSLTKLFVGSEGTLGIITEIILRLVPKQRPPATLVATFATLDDATATVLAITRRLRPSMLEFMDQPTIHAVEDMTKMGLDRDAAAMLVIQSDEPAGHATAECELIAGLCEENNAKEVFTTDDPDEGEAFVVARRNAIPAVERTGTLLLEDVGVPLPQLGALVDGIAEISAEARGHHRRHRPRRRRQHPPADRLRPRRHRHGRARPDGVRRGDGAGHGARRHHHRRARRRPPQAPLAGRLPRPRCPGPQPEDQGRPRPGRHPQPRRDVLTVDG